MRAAFYGHNASVAVLLSWGADVNQQDYHGFTALHAACKSGDLLCVLTLLKAGASLSLPSHRKTLPIHTAAQCNRTEIVRALLDHGCSPNMVSLI